MLFLWFYHACRRASPRFLMVADHVNYLTFEDPGAVNTVRRALKLAHAGDLYGAAETAGVDVTHSAVVSEGLRRGMRFSIGAEVDNDPRARPDAQNIVDAMRPDGIIRTVHFVNIEHPEKGADWPWPFDNSEFAHLHEIVSTEKLWELYTAKLFDDLEKLPTHIVGHFYMPAQFGHWPSQRTLEHYEDRLLDISHGRGLAVEINTRFLYRSDSEELRKKYLDANARLIRKAKARGVGIAVGSDAHSPKDQGNAFDVILGLLDDAKVNEIVFPVGARLARVALRATREHLEAHARTREMTTPGSSITGYSRAELGLPEEIESAGTRRESARAIRETGPKKRTGDATRPAKRSQGSGQSGKTGARRSADSSAHSSKAKAARGSVRPPSIKKAAPAKKGEVKTTKTSKSVKSKKKPAPPPKSKNLRSRSAAAKPPARKGAAKKSAAKKPVAKSAAKLRRPVRPALKKAPGKPARSASKSSAAKKKSAKRR
jgi:HisJ family histidinol phosphate phosphatase